MSKKEILMNSDLILIELFSNRQSKKTSKISFVYLVRGKTSCAFPSLLLVSLFLTTHSHTDVRLTVLAPPLLGRPHSQFSVFATGEVAPIPFDKVPAHSTVPVRHCCSESDGVGRHCVDLDVA